MIFVQFNALFATKDGFTTQKCFRTKKVSISYKSLSDPTRICLDYSSNIWGPNAQVSAWTVLHGRILVAISRSKAEAQNTARLQSFNLKGEISIRSNGTYKHKQMMYKAWKSNEQLVIPFSFVWQNVMSLLFKITCIANNKERKGTIEMVLQARFYFLLSFIWLGYTHKRRLIFSTEKWVLFFVPTQFPS